MFWTERIVQKEVDPPIGSWIVTKSVEASALLSRHRVPAMCVVAGIAGYCCRKIIVSAFHQWVGTASYSWVVDRVSKRHVSTLREEFRRITWGPCAPPVPTHSHKEAADDRGSATIMLNNFIQRAGYTPYSVSQSNKDQRLGIPGVRCFHFTKDAGMEYRRDELIKSSAFKFEDVDYYVDMKKVMSYGRPIFMYTWCPRRVAGETLNGCYTTHINNEVELIVNGGARYRHQLWDYDTDCVTVDRWWGTVIYNVEAARTTGDRRIVGLFPVRTIYGPLGWFLPGKRIERRVLIAGGMAVNRFFDDEKKEHKVNVSISVPGLFSDACLPDAVLTAAMQRAVSKGMDKVTTSDIERMVLTCGVKQPELISSMLYFIRNSVGVYAGITVKTGCGDVGPMSTADINYQTMSPLVTEDGTITGRVISVPFCSGNVAPVRSFNNDTSCVLGRITNTRNDVTTLPNKFHEYIAEFLDQLIPDRLKHAGVPLNNEEVEEHQNRPTQRRQWLDVQHFSRTLSRVVKSFQKAETYPKVTFPRNISTLNADHRTRYSSYIYQISKELLKPCPWYAFGKTPVEIAEEVQRVVRGAKHVDPSDYTSWDGTHSKMLVEFEQQLGKTFFHPDYHAEWDELILSQYKAPAITKQGVRYNTGYSRLSGSSDTSAFNSVDNALIAFIVLREMGNEADEAWKKLGLYGGDDGLTADTNTTVYSRVASRMGHTIKIDKIKAGRPVPFLGRYYLDPWTCDYSVIDIQRQVRRLHLTTSPETVPNRLAMVRKAQGYLITDRHTPFLSEWAHRVIEQFPEWVSASQYDELLRTDRSWFSQYDLSVQFPQDPHRTLAWGFAAEQLGVSVGDLMGYCEDLKNVNMERAGEPVNGTYLFPSLLTPVKVAAVIGGEVVYPPVVNDEEENVGREIVPQTPVLSVQLRPVSRQPGSSHRSQSSGSLASTSRDSNPSRPVPRPRRERGRRTPSNARSVGSH
jgi:hypothetical protein